MLNSKLKNAKGAARKLLERRRKAVKTQTDARAKAAVAEGELAAVQGDRAAAEVRAELDGLADGLAELRRAETEKRDELPRLQALDAGLKGALLRIDGGVSGVLQELNAARSEHAEAERSKTAEKIRSAFENITPILRQWAAGADSRGDTAAQNWIRGLKVPDPEDGRPDLFTGQPQEYAGGTWRPVAVWHGDAVAEKAFEKESGPRELAEELQQLVDEAHQRQSAERRQGDEQRAAQRPMNSSYRPMYAGRSRSEQGEEEPRPAPTMRPMVFHPDGRMEPIAMPPAPQK